MRVIFIDNGVTGSIGYFDGENADFMETPVLKIQDYTKAKKNISRIDIPELSKILDKYAGSGAVMTVIERPMINPTRFSASVSAARALEATLSALEIKTMSYMFSDSKEWQRGLLPSSGKKGVESSELNKDSKDIGIRLVPQFTDLIRKHGDADGILGAYQWYQKLNASAMGEGVNSHVNSEEGHNRKDDNNV